MTVSSVKCRMCFPYIFVLSLLFLCSCAKKEQAPRIDGNKAFAYAEKVASVIPRFSGSPGAHKTAEMIVEEASKIPGFDVKITSFQDLTPEGEKTFYNVSAEIPGPDDDFVVIGAHFDSKFFSGFGDRFQGANDGASGVGALLAMMHAISGTGSQPPIGLRFVFFDGEECLYDYGEHDGLHGSRFEVASLVRRLRDCRAMILLDMIGDRKLDVGFPFNTDLVLKRIAYEEAARLGFSAHFKEHGSFILDDHVPFQEKMIPVINFIDFNYGPNNTYWHTTADTIDKISPESLKIAADTALAVIWRIPGL